MLHFGRVGFAILALGIMLLWTPFFTELYRLSKSTGPCVLAHMIEDAIPTFLIHVTGIFTFKGLSDVFLNPISGLLSGCIFLAFGLFLRKKRIEKGFDKPTFDSFKLMTYFLTCFSIQSVQGLNP